MLAYIVPFLLFAMPVTLFILFNFTGLAVAIILDIVLIALSIRIVKPNTVMAVEFLGKFDRVLRSGLNFIIPVLEKTKLQVLFRRNFEVNVE